MEFVGVLYRCGIVLFGSMLRKGENMLKCGCDDCMRKFERSLGRYQPAKIRHEPAKIQNTPAIQKAVQRYYKLHCGDVLDIETKTILNREALLKILD